MTENAAMFITTKKVKLYHQPEYRPNEKLKSKQVSDLIYCQLMNGPAPTMGRDVIAHRRNQITSKISEVVLFEIRTFFVI